MVQPPKSGDPRGRSDDAPHSGRWFESMKSGADWPLLQGGGQAGEPVYNEAGDRSLGPVRCGELSGDGPIVVFDVAELVGECPTVDKQHDLQVELE